MTGDGSALKLHVVALGGTIASTRTVEGATACTGESAVGANAAGRSTGGVAPGLAGEEIAAAAGLDSALPGLVVSFDQVAQTSSANVTIPMLATAVESARVAAAAGASGVVLTQGTDTLEETAFVLSLLNDSGIPIVVTGAMRNPTVPGADGPANVRAAALLAVDPRIRRQRCLLVFADAAHDPIYVRKAHTSAVAAFTSGPELGAVGWCAEDRWHLPHLPDTQAGHAAAAQLQLAALHLGGGEEGDPQHGTQPGSQAELQLPVVPVVEIGMGIQAQLLEEISAHCAGLVLAGVGGGHVPESWVETVGQIAARMPVVLASRTGAGATLEHTYGYRGGEIDLLARGVISAGVLDARKARVLLTLCLLGQTPPAAAFAVYR